MNGERGPFLAWPGWKHLRFAAIVFAIGGLWFVLVYAGCDVITAQRTTRIRIHFGWELNIPFVPEAMWVYMSIYPLFVAAPFILRSRQELLALAITLNLVILVGGITFLLVPGYLAFAPPTHLGAFPGLFLFADRLNLTYNLVPSLHVALSAVCVAVFARRAAGFGKSGLWLWAMAIAVSTLLTHQHHLLDVIAGGLLAWGTFKLVYLPRIRC